MCLSLILYVLIYIVGSWRPLENQLGLKGYYSLLSLNEMTNDMIEISGYSEENSELKDRRSETRK